VWRQWRFPYACSRAVVAAEEEAGVEATAEETGSSGVDGSGGDRWSTERRSREQQGLREF
jgi:hypothetical protein